jgi:hypothetical protein
VADVEMRPLLDEDRLFDEENAVAARGTTEKMLGSLIDEIPPKV